MPPSQSNEDNISESSQENAPNSNREKSLKHKSLPLVHNNTDKLKWIAETNNKSKKIGSGRKAFYSEAEKRLCTWIIEQREQGLAILQQPDMVTLYDDSAKTFKMSHHWTVAFMKRNKLALRRRTRILQKLSEQTQELLEKFHEHIT
ncbi:15127_t:CDS:2 [Gigaspora rosea]|nr:15127_t:CDS:2 [Gigaspora rosea]